jgi:flagellar biosynthesis protein FliR
MTLAFPIKMLLSLTLLAWLTLVFPRVFTQSSRQVLQLIDNVLLH